MEEEQIRLGWMGKAVGAGKREESARKWRRRRKRAAEGERWKRRLASGFVCLFGIVHVKIEFKINASFSVKAVDYS